MKLPIGTLTITGPALHHFAGYETASWWTDYALPGGTFPVYLNDHGRVTAIVPGTVVRDHFVNRLFHASSVSNDVHVGRTSDVWLPVSLVDPGLTLADGWTVDTVTDPPSRPGWAPYTHHDLSFAGVAAHMLGFLLTSYPTNLTPAAAADRLAIADLLGLDRYPNGAIVVPA